MEKNINTLYINAMNIHSGGGAVLLRALLEGVDQKYKVILFTDERFDSKEIETTNLEIKKVKHTIIGRLKVELYFKTNPKSEDKVLYFGNLPPIFKIRGKVTVFLQNRYFLDSTPLKDFSIKAKFRIFVERMWFNFFKGNSDIWCVQTQTMKTKLASRFHSATRILITPLAPSKSVPKSIEHSKQKTCKDYSFAYIASGEPHKNHHTLIAAWNILAEEGIYPTLILTLNKHEWDKLRDRRNTNRVKLNVLNIGKISKNGVEDLLSRIDALIYPSLMESFGLPLLEARQAGSAIIASELDYVRDIIIPDETFDPNSPISIARSVKRYMDLPTEILQPITSYEFIVAIENEIKKL